MYVLAGIFPNVSSNATAVSAPWSYMWVGGGRGCSTVQYIWEHCLLAMFAFLVTAHESIWKVLGSLVVNKHIYNDVTQHFPNLFKHGTFFPTVCGSRIPVLQLPTELGKCWLCVNSPLLLKFYHHHVLLILPMWKQTITCSYFLS